MWHRSTQRTSSPSVRETQIDCIALVPQGELVVHKFIAQRNKIQFPDHHRACILFFS